MTTRICPGCGENRDCERDFYNSRPRPKSGRKDGKMSRCKKCMLAYSSERRRLKPPPSSRRRPKDFTCTGCGASYRLNGRFGSRRICASCQEHGRHCGLCKTYKPSDQFSPGGKACRPCLQSYNRERNYGFSRGTVEVVLAEFGDSCAICGAVAGGPSCPKQALHIDHCHSTGVVRGLLCSFCNSGLGYFRDDAGLLSAAIEYLARTRQLSFDETA